MSHTEEVLGRFLEEHKHGRLPPFNVCINYDIICANFPEHPKISSALLSIFQAINRQLPESYKVDMPELYRQKDAFPENRTSGPTIPLYEVVNVPKVLIEILYQFYYEVEDVGYEIRKKLQDNENAIHGLTPYSRRTKGVPLPTSLDMEPGDLAYAYLKGTPFELLFNTEVAFEIPRDRWPTHCVVLAPSEWGKSQLTGLFLREALEDPEPRAIILCDPHGDLYKDALTRIPADRLIAIDLTRNPPDLNILDHGVTPERDALHTFRFLISSLAGGLTAKQEGCVRPLFSLLREISGATLVTLHEIISEPVAKAEKSQFAKYFAKLSPVHRAFFQRLWFSGSFSDTREALMWKVGATIDDPTFNRMFSAKRNSITVSKWIEERKVVLVKSSDQLDREGTRLFFLYIIGQYYAAAKRRDALHPGERHLAQLFFDEASVIMQSPIIADILTEIRKYNCSFIAATQLWEHVAKEVRPAVLGSTGIRILGQLGHDEASALFRDQKSRLKR